MIDITDNNYREIAVRLREAIATTEWINSTLEGALTTSDDAAGTSPTIEWRLILSAIVYRRPDLRPEGGRRPVSDVVPVWWEFHTVGADGPVSNNFSFSELKPFLIDYD